jgi:2-oxoglutarate ferredoxin oxidoreductase subunit alpha
MIYGAAGAGVRAITSSSSPGISLKQEGISYCAGAQLPCVILNVMRGGPGLGNIQASQGDYFQAVKGGGNGDYHLLTFAPASVQEAIDLMMKAFDKAEQYRIPVLFLADGIIAQMMEPVEMPEMVDFKVDPGEEALGLHRLEARRRPREARRDQLHLHRHRVPLRPQRRAAEGISDSRGQRAGVGVPTILKAPSSSSPLSAPWPVYPSPPSTS